MSPVDHDDPTRKYPGGYLREDRRDFAPFFGSRMICVSRRVKRPRWKFRCSIPGCHLPSRDQAIVNQPSECGRSPAEHYPAEVRALRSGDPWR